MLIAAKNMQNGLRSPPDVLSDLANARDQKDLASNIKSRLLAFLLANVLLM